MKKAVVTIVVGDYAKTMAESTGPLMKSYADSCEADFVVITEPRFSSLGQLYYEKFQLHELYEEYERILYLDNDVLVSPDSPDVFRSFPATHFCASSEERWSKAAVCREAILAELPSIHWPNPYFNAGVMLASREHRRVFDPQCPLLLQWANDAIRMRYPYQGDDQTYFNYMVNSLAIPFLDIGHQFNHTRSIQETHTRFRSYFVHYAGPSGHRYGTRLEQIEKDACAFNNSLIRKVSRVSPLYRWIADRADPSFVRYLIDKFRL